VSPEVEGGPDLNQSKEKTKKKPNSPKTGKKSPDSTS